MVRTCSSVVMFLVFFAWCFLSVSSNDEPNDLIYHNQFAVHVPEGYDAANVIAEKYGFTNIGQVWNSTIVWL